MSYQKEIEALESEWSPEDGFFWRIRQGHRRQCHRGAREHGVLGGVAGAGNTVNPLYGFSVGAIDVDRKAEAGDTVGATAGGVELGLGALTAVVEPEDARAVPRRRYPCSMPAQARMRRARSGLVP
jgi:hypothetical protein